MFQSYKENRIWQPSVYPLIVIDDDFTRYTHSGWNGIIAVYEELKLPVLPNLIRAMMFFAKRRGTNLASVITDSMDYDDSNKVNQYIDELNRFLLLSE